MQLRSSAEQRRFDLAIGLIVVCSVLMVGVVAILNVG